MTIFQDIPVHTLTFVCNFTQKFRPAPTWSKFEIIIVQAGPAAIMLIISVKIQYIYYKKACLGIRLPCSDSHTHRRYPHINRGGTHLFFYKNRPDQNEAQIFLTFYILSLKIFLKNGDFQTSAKNIILNHRNFQNLRLAIFLIYSFISKMLQGVCIEIGMATEFEYMPPVAC